MILVNNPGNWGHIWRPLSHAEWHGCTPTDLIFPFFLFIVGTAGAISLGRRSAAGATAAQLARHAFTRGMTIALCGWLLAWFPFGLDRLLRLRIPGVLPRIGIVFVLGTWIVLAAGKRRAAVLWGAVAALLALHTALLLFPGFDLTREGNLQRAIDLAVLKGHLWKKDWDPEGILSTLTAVATMLTGTLAGTLLVSERPLSGKAGRLAAWGAGGLAAGLALSQWLPLNKNLWTGSYVLFASGAAAAGLALCVVLVDIRKTTFGLAFALPFGRNPLLAFVGSGLLAKILGLVKVAGASGAKVSLHRWLFAHGFSWIPDPVVASHAFAVATILFWWAILRACDRRGWYWKI